MKVKDLLQIWEKGAKEGVTADAYAIRLPLHDAARLHALADMYPGRSIEALVTDLLSAALDKIETAFPYIQGSRVIREDELGDAVYDDAGPTPRFVELTRKHLAQLDRRTQ